jgi:DNA invertase Pin-like site-specific DNA recombinase
LEVFADEGISGGRADNRPALQAALTLACAHGAAFVTYSLSRVARSVADTINISGRLEKCGADLVSLSENLDTTSASGRMLFNILAVLAQFERDLASERSSAVLRWKRAQGQKTGGHVPFGHDLADDGVNLRKNADEQRIVARIIRMRKRGASYHGIAAKLNADGVATKTGAKWHGKVIMTLCKRDQPSAA